MISFVLITLLVGIASTATVIQDYQDYEGEIANAAQKVEFEYTLVDTLSTLTITFSTTVQANPPRILICLPEGDCDLDNNIDIAEYNRTTIAYVGGYLDEVNPKIRLIVESISEHPVTYKFRAHSAIRLEDTEEFTDDTPNTTGASNRFFQFFYDQPSQEVAISVGCQEQSQTLYVSAVHPRPTKTYCETNPGNCLPLTEVNGKHTMSAETGAGIQTPSWLWISIQAPPHLIHTCGIVASFMTYSQVETGVVNISPLSFYEGASTKTSVRVHTRSDLLVFTYTNDTEFLRQMPPTLFVGLRTPVTFNQWDSYFGVTRIPKSSLYIDDEHPERDVFIRVQNPSNFLFPSPVVKKESTSLAYIATQDHIMLLPFTEKVEVVVKDLEAKGVFHFAIPFGMARQTTVEYQEEGFAHFAVLPIYTGGFKSGEGQTTNNCPWQLYATDRNTKPGVGGQPYRWNHNEISANKWGAGFWTMVGDDNENKFVSQDATMFMTVAPKVREEYLPNCIGDHVHVYAAAQYPVTKLEQRIRYTSEEVDGRLLPLHLAIIGAADGIDPERSILISVKSTGVLPETIAEHVIIGSYLNQFPLIDWDCDQEELVSNTCEASTVSQIKTIAGEMHGLVLYITVHFTHKGPVDISFASVDRTQYTPGNQVGTISLESGKQSLGESRVRMALNHYDRMFLAVELMWGRGKLHVCTMDDITGYPPYNCEDADYHMNLVSDSTALRRSMKTTEYSPRLLMNNAVARFVEQSDTVYHNARYVFAGYNTLNTQDKTIKYTVQNSEHTYYLEFMNSLSMISQVAVEVTNLVKQNNPWGDGSSSLTMIGCQSFPPMANNIIENCRKTELEDDLENPSKVMRGTFNSTNAGTNYVGLFFDNNIGVGTQLNIRYQQSSLLGLDMNNRRTVVKDVPSFFVVVTPGVIKEKYHISLQITGIDGEGVALLSHSVFHPYKDEHGKKFKWPGTTFFEIPKSLKQTYVGISVLMTGSTTQSLAINIKPVYIIVAAFESPPKVYSIPFLTSSTVHSTVDVTSIAPYVPHGKITFVFAPFELDVKNPPTSIPDSFDFRFSSMLSDNVNEITDSSLTPLASIESSPGIHVLTVDSATLRPTGPNDKSLKLYGSVTSPNMPGAFEGGLITNQWFDINNVVIDTEYYYPIRSSIKKGVYEVPIAPIFFSWQYTSKAIVLVSMCTAADVNEKDDLERVYAFGSFVSPLPYSQKKQFQASTASMGDQSHKEGGKDKSGYIAGVSPGEFVLYIDPALKQIFKPKEGEEAVDYERLKNSRVFVGIHGKVGKTFETMVFPDMGVGKTPRPTASHYQLIPVSYEKRVQVTFGVELATYKDPETNFTTPTQYTAYAMEKTQAKKFNIYTACGYEMGGVRLAKFQIYNLDPETNLVQLSIPLNEFDVDEFWLGIVANHGGFTRTYEPMLMTAKGPKIPGELEWWAILLIVLACIAVVALVGFLVWWCCFRTKPEEGYEPMGNEQPQKIPGVLD